jgi:hypothetical protein
VVVGSAGPTISPQHKGKVMMTFRVSLVVKIFHINKKPRDTFASRIHIRLYPVKAYGCESNRDDYSFTKVESKFRSLSASSLEMSGSP